MRKKTRITLRMMKEMKLMTITALTTKTKVMSTEISRAMPKKLLMTTPRLLKAKQNC